jgi:hypothetical protein
MSWSSQMQKQQSKQLRQNQQMGPKEASSPAFRIGVAAVAGARPGVGAGAGAGVSVLDRPESGGCMLV